jgi:glutathione S-transferase
MPAAGSRERFQVLQWLTFISSELHKAFSPWLFHKETADTTRQAVKEKIATRFAELDAHLAKNEWLAGRIFTVADAYAFAIVNWVPWVGMNLSAWPHLAAYMDRVRARAQVRAALDAEGLK